MPHTSCSKCYMKLIQRPGEDPHEKTNRYLIDINRCLTDIFKIQSILTNI